MVSNNLGLKQKFQTQDMVIRELILSSPVGVIPNRLKPFESTLDKITKDMGFMRQGQNRKFQIQYFKDLGPVNKYKVMYGLMARMSMIKQGRINVSDTPATKPVNTKKKRSGHMMSIFGKSGISNKTKTTIQKAPIPKPTSGPGASSISNQIGAIAKAARSPNLGKKNKPEKGKTKTKLPSPINIVKGLSAKNIGKISIEQIKILSLDQIKALSLDQIKALSLDQIKALTTKQIKALSTKQIQALSIKQIEGFSIKQIEGFSIKQIKGFSIDQLKTLGKNIKNLQHEVLKHITSEGEIHKLSDDQLIHLGDTISSYRKITSAELQKRLKRYDEKKKKANLNDKQKMKKAEDDTKLDLKNPEQRKQKKTEVRKAIMDAEVISFDFDRTISKTHTGGYPISGKLRRDGRRGPTGEVDKTIWGPVFNKIKNMTPKKKIVINTRGMAPEVRQYMEENFPEIKDIVEVRGAETEAEINNPFHKSEDQIEKEIIERKFTNDEINAGREKYGIYVKRVKRALWAQEEWAIKKAMENDGVKTVFFDDEPRNTAVSFLTESAGKSYHHDPKEADELGRFLAEALEE